MTSTLHDHLARLADQVDPAPDPASGRDLWARGVRYQRRRRTGTAVIAGVAALLVVGVGVVTWQRSAPTVIAPAGAPVGLPSRVYEPNPWLPGTAGHAIGPLVAIMSAERGQWWGSDWETVGIAASTGEYRFLDLPDEASDTDPALAPDGRHVAYWTTGPTSGTPNTAGGQSDTVTGVAVYDTVTGDVHRHLIETEHGLWDEVLVWLDSDTLAIDINQYVGGDDASDMDRSSGRYAPGLRWDLGQEPVPFPAVDGLSVGLPAPPSNGDAAVFYGENQTLTVLSDRGAEAELGDGFVDPQTAAVSPSGALVAGVSERGGRSPNQVMVSTVKATGDPIFSTLPNSDQTFRAIGWRDDDHVLVERRVGGKHSMRSGIFSVDARTGESELLVTQPESSFRNTIWAGELLAAPVVDRPEPPRPLSPRLVAVLLVLAVGGGLFGVWRWRRRVEP